MGSCGVVSLLLRRSYNNLDVGQAKRSKKMGKVVVRFKKLVAGLTLEGRTERNCKGQVLSLAKRYGTNVTKICLALD